MKLYRLSIFVIILSLVLGLTACTRSAATPKSSNATAVPTNSTSATEVFDVIQSFATQTAAAALLRQPTPAAPVAQPTEAVPVVQPTEAQQVPQQPTATVAAVVVPTATPGIPTSYTLHQGEFPFCIARRFNVDPAELLSINGLNSRSLYYAGMVLKIPQTGHTFPGNRVLRAHPTTYTVTAGETIYSIACLFGDVDPSAIAFANNLTSPYKLTSGQVLNIP